MVSLTHLLTEHGYAPAATEKFIKSAVAPITSDDHEIERYFNALASNYYMQYLALKLDQYGFNLNRPDIPPDQLSRADNLIRGKLGNPPLDNPYVVQFLENWVVQMRKMHLARPMSWNDFFEAQYTASDGVSLPGCEIVKALLRSNQIYKNDRSVHYRHRYNGINFRTISMNELMAHVLPEVDHSGLQDINKYGREVTNLAIDNVRNVLRTLDHLAPPRFDKFFEVNTHHRIMQTIQKLKFAIGTELLDLQNIGELQQALKKEKHSRYVYPEDWQRFIGELESAMDSVVTPYSQDGTDETRMQIKTSIEEIQNPQV